MKSRILATATMLMLTVALCSCSSSEEKARADFNNAQVMMRAGDYEGGVAILNAIVEKYPETETCIKVNDVLNVFDADKKNQQTKQTVIKTFLHALSVFLMETGKYPSKEEGLAALFDDPGITGWDGPYLGGEMLKYIYLYGLTYQTDGKHDIKINTIY